MLPNAQLELLRVQEHLRQIEALGNELLEVGGRLGRGEAPRRLHRVEEAVGDVEVVVLGQGKIENNN
jgi:hypothetical protein